MSMLPSNSAELSPEDIAVYNEFMFPPIEDETKVHRRYKTLVIYKETCGSGSFGVVHKGKLFHHGKVVDVAVKIFKRALDRSYDHEMDFYRKANMKTGLRIPKLYAHLVTKNDGRMIIMELMGPSLKQLWPRFTTLKTVLMIADQILPILEKLHDRGYIHRDIKPQNFVVDRTEKKIYLIDFGLVDRYLDDNGQHKMETESHLHSAIGTSRFMSIHAHSGEQQSRKDDLLSMMHVLMYFYRGGVPWLKSGEKNFEMLDPMRIRDCKSNMMQGFLREMPDVFGFIYNKLLELKFDEKPQYKYYRALFSNYARLNFEEDIYDDCFDWNDTF